MTSAGICGSDVGIYHGTNAAATYPRIIGHEIVGVVEETGEGVTRVKAGDRVIVDQVNACGKCWACRHGRPNVCGNLKVRGVHIDGGYRQWIAVQEDKCYLLPDEISDRDAIMIEPTTIAIQSCSRAELCEEDTLLIIGAGALVTQGKTIPAEVNHLVTVNLFTTINVTATVASGYSTGEAIKAAQDVAAEILPAGYSYDYQGLTREEAKASNTTAIIFLLCFIFIYLILSAQYESYILPLAVVLSVPFGLAGCFLFTMMFGHANDIYMQISLIMLIGLLAKNAILIVQFALERRQMGMAITWSAILGAAARLRPILMTSLAMVIGLLPMMFASGVGKNGNQTLGAAAVGGMLLGTLFQIIVVPGLFVIFQSLQEKISPIKFEGEEENPDVATEIAQYAHRPVDYELEK